MLKTGEKTLFVQGFGVILVCVCVCIVSVLDRVRSESAGAKNWTAWSFPSCLRRNPGVQRVCWRTESKKRQNWLPVNGLWNFFHFKLILLLHNISFWSPFNSGLQNFKKKKMYYVFFYIYFEVHSFRKDYKVLLLHTVRKVHRFK